MSDQLLWNSYRLAVAQYAGILLGDWTELHLGIRAWWAAIAKDVEAGRKSNIFPIRGEQTEASRNAERARDEKLISDLKTSLAVSQAKIHELEQSLKQSRATATKLRKAVQGYKKALEAKEVSMHPSGETRYGLRASEIFRNNCNIVEAHLLLEDEYQRAQVNELLESA